jgi:lipopolysaccharide export LptBFGC system permease protein LptF
VSKQLSVSAAFAVFAMAAFALSTAPRTPRPTEMGAPTLAAAPAFEILLPGS